MSEGIEPQYFKAHSGESVRLTPIPITNADGSPTDLTGTTPFFCMAKVREGDPVVFSSGIGSNCTVEIVAPETDGIVRVTLPKTTTEVLEGAYYWELWLTDGSGNEVVAAYGYADFLPNIG